MKNTFFVKDSDVDLKEKYLRCGFKVVVIHEGSEKDIASALQKIIDWHVKMDA